MYIYICICVSGTLPRETSCCFIAFRESDARRGVLQRRIPQDGTSKWANDTLRGQVKILDFRGLHCSMILILRGGILMSIRNFLESLRRRISVGIISAVRLGASDRSCHHHHGPRLRCPQLTKPQANALHDIYIYIYTYRERERCKHM